MQNLKFPNPQALCALTLAAALSVGSAWAVPVSNGGRLVQVTAQLQTPALPDSQPEQAAETEVVQYLRYAPRMLALGYSQEEVDLLFSSMSAPRLLPLLRRDYTPLAAQCARQPHFRDTLLERYLRYGQENPSFSPEQVVTRVNIGLDRAGYSNVRTVADPGAQDVLVNKYRFLGSTFVPELVRMGSAYANYGAYMEPTAYSWFKKMVDDARAQGLKLYCVSAYRSYTYQSSLYRRYVSRDGQEQADTYSARPGYSEHQTGLAVDINTASRSAHFENTSQYLWLKENSWKYGFILRYPEGKEDITGFCFEPWHYRYVGTELAKAVHESGLTYDEYVASQPSEKARPAQSLTVQGRTCTLSRAPLRLGDVYYLPADELAAVLRLAYSVDAQGTAVLSGGGRSLMLTRDQTQCLSGESVQTLANAPFVQGGDLLVPVMETVRLLGIGAEDTGETIALSSHILTGPESYL